jgi:cell division protein ZapA (FtsZ GTPase activity inhibitor)
LEQTFTIELFGQSYTFETDGDVSQAKKLAAFVVDEVTKVRQEVTKTSATISDMAILILAILNIAGRNIEFEKSQTEFSKKISERVARLNRLLDADSPPE